MNGPLPSLEESVMKAVRLLPLCAVLLGTQLSCVARTEELPPAGKETLDAYEKEATEVQQKVDEEIHKFAEKAVSQLKIVKEKFCQQAKLDEAVAVRDQIRLLQSGETKRRATALPPAAAEIMDAFEKNAAALQQKAEERLQKVRDKADVQLKMIQDKFCKEDKLDEAIAIRDTRRLIQLGVTNARPDPGYLHAEASDIGKVWYFEVVGNAREFTWGTEVYTSDAHLGASAVHAGVLADGQKGIVKVTILPGQNSYPSTTRNGVTSQAWGVWGVSFKVERLPGLVRSAAITPPQRRK
jgi:hypothetical protein